jgi:hypothetical protein
MSSASGNKEVQGRVLDVPETIVELRPGGVELHSNEFVDSKFTISSPESLSARN